MSNVLREDFERLISSSPFEKSIERFPNEPDNFAWPGSYRDISVNLAWEFFQRGHNARGLVYVKELIDLVNIRGFSIGSSSYKGTVLQLWFKKGLSQKRLMLLHNVLCSTPGLGCYYSNGEPYNKTNN